MIKTLKLLALTALLSTSAFATITVEKAWIRPSTGPNGAMFMKLSNDAKTETALKEVTVAGDFCNHTELHTHLHEDGVMKMREVESLKVPGQGYAELKPGADHVMLMGLKRGLKQGDVIPVSLTLESGQTLTLDVTVQDCTADGICH